MKTKKWILGLMAVAGILLVASAAIAEINLATDPTRIGVGARALGMGKAYVALAEDGDTLFMNPAGLGCIDSPKLSSMYTNLMGDVSYVVVGGIYPNGQLGALGGGLIYSGSGVDFWNASGTPSGSGTWSSNLLLLSYGLDLNKVGVVNFGPVQFGGTLKYFSRGGSGSSTVEAASATGMDLDLGLLISPASWWRLGLVQQNLLQSNITNGYSVADRLPGLTKAGVKIGVLGAEEKALIPAEQKLDLEVDADIALSNTNVPTVLHIGAEYWPLKVLALRMGVDQNALNGGVVSNYTAGVGLRYGGIEFDYAYHPYYGIAEDATHFLSISYVGETKAPVMVPFKVSLNSPVDKSIIYDEFVNVEGAVEGNQVGITANGVVIPVVDGKFNSKVPVDRLGKKLIVIKAADAFGNAIEENRRILRLASFTDVGEGYWAKAPIENTGTVGLVQGYPDGTFKPERALTRAELAVLVVRSKGIELPKVFGKIFSDVAPDHWGAPYIKVAKAYGWVEGYPDGSYKPNNQISKAEAVTILARLDELNVDRKIVDKPYQDVSTGHWAARYIEAAKSAGLLDYLKGETLAPANNVSRAEFVEMLSKTSFADKQIIELFSWAPLPGQ